jgi:hypothetical protein
MDTSHDRRGRSVLIGLGAVLAFEYLLILIIPAYIYDKLRIAFEFAVAMSSATPLVFRFYPVAAEPQSLGFFLALSPFFLIAKVVLVIRWLGSDLVRIYRYWMISPTATSVRTIGLSVAIVLLAFLLGIFWPYYVFGLEHVREFEQTYGTADFRDQWMLQGGWRLWLSWSVFQMGISALFLAMGYCVLREYMRWEHGIFEGRGAAVFKQLPFAVFAGVLACVGAYMLLRLPTYQTVSRPGDISAWLLQIQATVCGAVAGLCIGHLFGRTKVARWSYAFAAPLAIALTTFLLACVFVWSHGAPLVKDLGPFMAVILVWLSWCLMFTAGVLRDPMVALIDVLAIAGAVLLIRRSAPSGRAGGSGIGDAVPALGGKQAGA